MARELSHGSCHSCAKDGLFQVRHLLVAAHPRPQQPVAERHGVLRLLVAPIGQHPGPAAVGAHLRDQLAEVIRQIHLDGGERFHDVGDRRGSATDCTGPTGCRPESTNGVSSPRGRSSPGRAGRFFSVLPGFPACIRLPAQLLAASRSSLPIRALALVARSCSAQRLAVSQISPCTGAWHGASDARGATFLQPSIVRRGRLARGNGRRPPRRRFTLSAAILLDSRRPHGYA